jgi:hypothetical protein
MPCGLVDTDIREESAASIFKVYPEDGSCQFPLNISKYISDQKRIICIIKSVSTSNLIILIAS